MNRRILIGIISAIMLSLLAGCSQPLPEAAPQPQQQEAASASPAETMQPETQPVSPEPSQTTAGPDLLLQQMTLEEKVGQMFIIRPDALDLIQTPEQIYDPDAEGVTELSSEMADVLKKYHVGGIALFGKNILTPQQLTGFVEELQNAGGIPLFMAVDEEGGTVARLANNSAFDVVRYSSAADVGASGDAAAAESMGAAIGAYLHQYGFNLDFAPVADVNSNPDNTVIGDRAFSSDAGTAAKMAKAMAEGLKQQRIIPTFKHFPGHGDTAEDSHNGIAVSYKSKEEMESCEWLPYEGLGAENCVMVGHIAAPEITGDLTPASMSPEIVNDILRQQLGFDGVVITDSLAMGAVTDSYTPGEAAVNAIEAGCDILLCPYDLQQAFEAVVDAVNSGTISEERIDESVYRILLLKQTYGLLQ